MSRGWAWSGERLFSAKPSFYLGEKRGMLRFGAGSESTTLTRCPSRVEPRTLGGVEGETKAAFLRQRPFYPDERGKGGRAQPLRG